MREGAILAQTRKLADITRFAFGGRPHVAIDLECNHHGMGRKAEIYYRVYISPDSPSGAVAHYRSKNWKDVLSLVTWLEDVEASVTYRDR